jgi:hypothetical protein
VKTRKKQEKNPEHHETVIEACVAVANALSIPFYPANCFSCVEECSDSEVRGYKLCVVWNSFSSARRLNLQLKKPLGAAHLGEFMK